MILPRSIIIKKVINTYNQDSIHKESKQIQSGVNVKSALLFWAAQMHVVTQGLGYTAMFVVGYVLNIKWAMPPKNCIVR